MDLTESILAILRLRGKMTGKDLAVNCGFKKGTDIAWKLGALRKEGRIVKVANGSNIMWELPKITMSRPLPLVPDTPIKPIKSKTFREVSEEYYNYIINSGRQINKTQYVREMGFISALTKNPPIDELNAAHLNRIFEYSLIRQVKNKTARNKFTTIMRIYKFALARDYILDNKRFNIEKAVNGLMAQYDKLLKKYKQKPVAPAAPVTAPVPVIPKPKDNLRLLKDLRSSWRGSATTG